MSRLVFGAAIVLIIGIGAVAVLAVSALVSRDDISTGETPAVEEPESAEPSSPPREPTQPVGAGTTAGPLANPEVSPQTATIRVLGEEDDEIEFRGAVSGSDGTRYVGGVTPARYRVPVTEEVEVVRASFQKQGGPGTLTVQIVSGNEVVAEQEISSALERASVSWEPDEE